MQTLSSVALSVPDHYAIITDADCETVMGAARTILENRRSVLIMHPLAERWQWIARAFDVEDIVIPIKEDYEKVIDVRGAYLPRCGTPGVH